MVSRSPGPVQYRQGVSACVVDSDNKFLLVQPHQYDYHEWSLVGGGVDPGESDLEALLREIEEELGILEEHMQLVCEKPYICRYTFPEHKIGSIFGEPAYIGQIKTVYLLKFIGSKQDITPNAEEIRAIHWAHLAELPRKLRYEAYCKVAEVYASERLIPKSWQETP